MRSLEEVLHHRRWRRTVVRAPLFNRRVRMAAGRDAVVNQQSETAVEMRRKGQHMRPRIIWNNERCSGEGWQADLGHGPQDPDGAPTAG